MTARIVLPAALASGLLFSSQALAFPEGDAGISVFAQSDDRRRGLSWSDGKASLSGKLSIPVGAGIEVEGGAATLRGSRRHEGADAGFDVGGRYSRDFGPWQLSAGATRRLFLNRSYLNYVELDAALAHTIGPVRLGGSASYAPTQDAIGGDNLYLSASADTAMPGTAFTIFGGLGRSSGKVDNMLRAARLRPDGGSYWDYRLGIERVTGPAVIGARFSTTSGTGDAGEHDGSRLVAYAGFNF